jgi:DNA repair exonuclease SbcCD ATPase subunit
MANDLTTEAFDYSALPQDQAMQLKIISTRLRVRVERTAEEMLAMGADLQEAKKVCKGNGEAFKDWCSSSECPVGYETAKRLMAISLEYADKKVPGTFFENNGFKVIASLTQTRDEDIRTALSEYIEQRNEAGESVTQQEFNALRKALASEQERVKQLEGEVFDTKTLIKGYMAERDEAKEARDRAIVSRDKAIHELMEKDSLIKQKDSAIRAKMEELQDAEAVYKEQLEDMRKRIIDEERNRPRTDAEVAEQQRKLEALRAEEQDIKNSRAGLAKEVRDLKSERDDLAKQQRLWTKIVNDFYASAIKFHAETAMIIGASQALKDIPISDELYNQVQTIIKDAEKVAEVMRDAISV